MKSNVVLSFNDWDGVRRIEYITVCWTLANGMVESHEMIGRDDPRLVIWREEEKHAGDRPQAHPRLDTLGK